MAMTPEGKVKEAIKAKLKAYNMYYTMPATGGYGASGAPDFIAVLSGTFVGIEAKAAKGKLSALQRRALREIWRCGGIPVVVGPDDVEGDMTDTLDSILNNVRYDHINLARLAAEELCKKWHLEFSD